MLNFGASKPRVKGGARAPGAPPGSAPGCSCQYYSGYLVFNVLEEKQQNVTFCSCDWFQTGAFLPDYITSKVVGLSVVNHM